MSANDFVDTCVFVATAGGTVDFASSGAVTGYQTPSGAGCVDGKIYTYRAQSADLSQWEDGEGAYTASTQTIARTTIRASSSGAKVSFTSPPQVAVVILSSEIKALIRADVAQSLTSAQQDQARSNIGYIGKNVVINGGMEVDQEHAGASQTFTAGAALAYCVDQFYGYCTGANVTGQQVAGAGTTRKRYQFTGAASVTAIGFGQRIELADCFYLNGKTATLSVDLANSLLTTVTWTAYYANSADTFGTLASPTRTQIATGTFTVNGTVANYSASMSVPAAATTGIEIVLTVGAQTSGTWTIGNVQLELGSVATSFEKLSYNVALARCRRHFATSYGIGTAPGAATRNGISQGCTGGYNGAQVVLGGFTIPLPVEMRAVPTVVFYDGAGAVSKYSSLSAGAGSAPSWTDGQVGDTPVITGIGTTAFMFAYSGTSGGFFLAAIHWTASARL